MLIENKAGQWNIWLKTAAVTMGFASLILASTAANAAVDMFLELDKGKIQGESRDKSHAGSIDVLAWSWGMSSSGSMGMAGGRGSAQTDFQDISITKWIDLSSTSLMQHLASGQIIPEATLTVRKAGAKPLEYIVIKMTKVMVTSLATGGSGGEDKLSENVTLSFAEVDVTYKQQADDGSAAKSTEFKWDITKNAAK